MPDASPTLPTIRGGVAARLPHDSAIKHVSGRAVYTDDIPEPPGLLQVYLRLSDRAHARIVGIDTGPVRSSPGVVDVLTAADVPGLNDIGPVYAGDPVFADGLVHYAGQSVFAVVAETLDQAREAAHRAVIAYEDLEPILTIEQALERQFYIEEPQVMQRGDGPAAVARAPHRLTGRFEIGGQDHFYLEGHIAMAIPNEDGDVLIHSSTQHPSEVQHMVARVLGKPDNAVTVEVRRLGGGFGGKETQPALFASIAALAAVRTGRPVKLRLDRDDDMVNTGKRHDFLVRYDVGFDDDGRIQGLDLMLASRCGMSADLSPSINDRAMFHSDNCYYLPEVRITSYRCRTNTVSNTAFRGFGGPQGMLAIEQVVDEIARQIGRDPLDVRRINLYGTDDRNVTPYHQVVEDNIAPEIIDRLERSADYRERRQAVERFNARHSVLKKGLALTPVKFGISFTANHLNQGGALLHVYTDGSIHLNHGGIEMGQGLFQKVAQVVAEELQVDIDRIKITATNTGKVPNTSATAASSGADINGKAAQAAARTIRERLSEFAARHFGVAEETVRFVANSVQVGDRALSFGELAKLAYMNRVQLSATGFYRTPKIHYDRKQHRGRPFFYFAYGAAVSEVVIDTLTGEYRVCRVDVLHDVGRSINPAIDIGQVEGGFVQGMGWLTTEELWWDAQGRLRTHAPSTYKIPTSRDVPEDFRVELLETSINREDTVFRSKAVGEPPLMLANSVFLALKDAVAAAGGHRASPHLHAPATPERVLMAIQELRQRAARPVVAEATAAE
jgi:xanthine dehydrogenase large subunit